MLSLMYEGRFYSFPPVTYLDGIDLTVIRPLMFVWEAEIIGFKNKYELPVVKNLCPADGHTKRQEVKELIRVLNPEESRVKERMHGMEIFLKESDVQNNSLRSTLNGRIPLTQHPAFQLSLSASD